jgi:hypothetical protein
MTNEHMMVLVNMTLEKPSWGKPVRERYIYEDLQAQVTRK